MYRLIWKRQKLLEIKLQTFTDTVFALSSYETDIFDFELQKTKAVYEGGKKKIELRPETSALLLKVKGMVNAFFSEKAYEKLDLTLRTECSIENEPNTDFEENRKAIILLLANELGLGNPKDISCLCQRLIHLWQRHE